MPFQGTNVSDIREKLRAADSELYGALSGVVDASGIGGTKRYTAKWINDPIWKTVQIQPCELALIDTTFFQRLRRVRQLGLAYLVYPGAHHSRFEHSIGAVEASTRIYRRIAQPDKVPSAGEHVEDVIRLAALMHDVGHPAFSHLGERVLERLLGDRFEKFGNVLDSCLGDSDEWSNRKKPAEIASVVALMEYAEVLKPYLGDQEILRACCLILGKTAKFEANQDTLDFIDFIISGDLDVDKIDYVARDAYFAGVPVSSDVDRLINQLQCAVRTKPSGRRQYLFGVTTAGASPVEMFVLTRAYLFDRLYRHPKIRAAEGILFNEMLELLKNQQPVNVIEFLYNLGGDDACLSRLHADKKTSVFVRKLPERALAISQRTMVGYDPSSNETLEVVRRIWVLAEDSLSNPADFEDYVARISDALNSKSHVIMNVSPHRPIDEEPNVFIAERDSPLEPKRINETFDVQRFSNAYQDRHSVGWLFGPSARRTQVAAAGAIALVHFFGLMVSSSAIDQARITKSEFIQALEEIRQRKAQFIDGDEVSVIAGQLIDVFGERLRAPIKMLESQLPGIWQPEERREFSSLMATGVNQLNLSNSIYREFDRALRVLGICLEHAEHALGSSLPQEMFESEADFQRSLHQFSTANLKGSNIFVEMERSAANGYPDLVFTFGSLKIAVELKSEPKRFEAIVQDWAPQAEAYASNSGYCRFAILYVECLNPGEKQSSLMRVETNSIGEKNLITLCIALRRQGKSANAAALGVQRSRRATRKASGQI